MNWHVELIQGEVKYSFVTWQNDSMPKFDREMVFYLDNPVISR